MGRDDRDASPVKLMLLAFPLVDLPATSLTTAIAVLTAMITPALLISASGTFILSTSNRLGRVVDRARQLVDRMEALIQEEGEAELYKERRAMLHDQLDQLSLRATLLQRTLTILYLASGVFVATSVAIGMVSVVASPHFNWVPVVLGITGACFLFYGCLVLITEARIAVRSLRSEMSFLGLVARQHGTNFETR